MNSASFSSPNSEDSDESRSHGNLSTQNYGAEECPQDENGMNGYTSLVDCGETLSYSESNDECDELLDGKLIHKLILECQETESTSLDLSRRGMKSLCCRLLGLSQLQVNTVNFEFIPIILKVPGNSKVHLYSAVGHIMPPEWPCDL